MDRCRYKNNDTILAADLKNEPHGKQVRIRAPSGTVPTDVDNWKYTAQTAAKRILAINPKLLIMVEGIEVYPRQGASWTATGLSDYYGTWWVATFGA